MRKSAFFVLSLLLLLAAAFPAWSQRIVTSATTVPSLNALLTAPVPIGPRPATNDPVAGDDALAAHTENDDAAQSTTQVLQNYGRAPLTFVANGGQTDPRVRYYAQGTDYAVYFTSEEVIFTFIEGTPATDERFDPVTPVARRNGAVLRDKQQATRGLALALQFIGGDPAVQPEGQHRATGKVNHLIGNDPARWRMGLPTYGEIVYPELWPGVALVFSRDKGQLKQEFLLRPGARIEDVRLAYEGAEEVFLDQAGNLIAKTSLGVLADQRPRSYQEIDGKQVAVGSRFDVRQASNGKTIYGFELGEDYDPAYPLTIDPGLVYSTYFGRGYVPGPAIAVDDLGDAYLVGVLAGLLPTPGAFDTSPNGGTDVFVAKLNADGSGLVYATFLGGNSDDRGTGIAVDTWGNAYVAGHTRSPDFPTTAGALDQSFGGVFDDVFLTKLDASGASLLYSTYLGGSHQDIAADVAIDVLSNTYVVGTTRSTDFPITPGAFDTSFDDGVFDAFVAKLDMAASGPASLVYSTFLGGPTSASNAARSIAVDALGNAYLTGSTRSLGFPTTANAFDSSINGTNDSFVTKLDASGSSLLYSSYLGGGGTGWDIGSGIAVDDMGNAYVIGSTQTADFPTTSGAFAGSHSTSGWDAFVSRVDTTASGVPSLVYSTFLGGETAPNGAWGYDIAVDAVGSAYVTGFTDALVFPTRGAFDPSSGWGDAFVAKLDTLASGEASLLYSTYLGGSGQDTVGAIAIDDSGNAYVMGQTNSFSDFPTTPGAFDTSPVFPGGSSRLYVSKLDLIPLTPEEQIQVLIGDVEMLVTAGDLPAGPGAALIQMLDQAIRQLESGNEGTAVRMLQNFIRAAEAFERAGVLPTGRQLSLISGAINISNELTS